MKPRDMIRAGVAFGLALGRGGSKGLPGKNTRLLGGHPLIAWSVAAGKLSPAVSRVICSTDCDDIAACARTAGAEVLFRRPIELASATATDLQVFGHLISWLLENEGELPEFFVQLRPTTPFRLPEWIDLAITILQENPQASSVRSITPTPITPYKMWCKSDGGGKLSPALDAPGIFEAYNRPRDGLPQIYWHTGQIDVVRTATILDGSMTGPLILGLDVPLDLAADIDTLIDFQLAQLRFDEFMPASLKEYLVRL